MNYSALNYLVLYVMWAMVLLAFLGGWRITEVLTKRKKPTEFPAGIKHGSEMYWRLNRAHSNALENIPIYAALIITAFISGVNSGLFHYAVAIAFYARIGQSLSHISSGGIIAVNVRFAFFLTQVICFILMGIECLKKISML